MEEIKEEVKEREITPELVTEADRILADYSKRTGIAISPDLTQEQRVSIATQLMGFEKKWASLDRRQKRKALGSKRRSSNRIKAIMKGHAIKELIVKKYEKAVKRMAKQKDMPEPGVGLIDQISKEGNQLQYDSTQNDAKEVLNNFIDSGQ